VNNSYNFFTFILLLASIYSATRILLKAYKEKESVFYLYGGAGIALIITLLGKPVSSIINNLGINENVESVYIWGSVIAIAFVLSGLMLLIRNSKPEFARFPAVFVGLPILLILSFPFVADSMIIMYWLIGIYEACAIIVAIMMHSVLSLKNKTNYFILGGIGILLMAYLFYWLPVELFRSESALWQTVLAIGIIVLVHGYEKLETTERDESLAA
jgi:hypothetical protein